ncbi:aldehyde dehydrogenase family protein [Pigmentiphaga sp. GD03639]|uniref:aldehyde dehydrogenase family protein n=1 Tax=unclassified Pigmentiphaga TaxID=2626614 RepID=UPI00104B1EBA|nr:MULTISPECIES: aldehyde dehydrogenase family protein [unclassified Pigmentiphaga]MDH2235895.1 aldehyde dehydrogenase family protein [Pigmentiphaga sp. GD03639]
MHANYIAGQWLEGEGATRDINPSDVADLVGEYAHATPAQVDLAIAAARDAAHRWGLASATQRAECLDAIGIELLRRKDELGRLLAREEGKTLPEAVGETVRAAAIFRFFAGEALRVRGDRLPQARTGVDVEVTREPVGVVGLITPWNFPLAIPAWKIAPALAYGNTVVFKPADLVPGSAWALAEIISRAGLPEGVFNLVMGRGAVVGQAMLDDARIDALSFTGSVATGRQVAQAATRRLAKVQMEMGGKNPLVVLDDADLGQAVECAVQGSFFSTGQRCTASSRLIVQRGIHERFVRAMKERMAALRVDDALAPGTDIGPVVDARQLQQDEEYLRIGRDEGATLAQGGRRVARAREGYYLEPALFTDCSNDMRICREEIFGPVAAVIPVADYDEALALANDTEFGLSAGICTTSLKHATHFKRHAQAGMVMVNCPTAGVDPHAPFGGRKGSSYGPREQGTYAAEFYTTVKTAYTLA